MSKYNPIHTKNKARVYNTYQTKLLTVLATLTYFPRNPYLPLAGIYQPHGHLKRLPPHRKLGHGPLGWSIVS